MLVALVVAVPVISAQAQSRPPTTEQLGRDPGALRQEAEQQRAQERAQQQRDGQQQADQQWNDTLRQNRSRAAADAAQGDAVLRSWQQRPPLASDRNPLLGRWESLGPGQRPAAAGLPPEIARMAAELVGGMTIGLCDSMLGRGTIEFRPSEVVAIGRDAREHRMYRAEYRGGGSRVVVLPQGGTRFTHMIIDFGGPDRATVAVLGCGLRRSGGSAAARSTSLATNTAPAEGAGTDRWTLLGTSAMEGHPEVYLSPSSIRRAGALANMAEMWDFRAPHPLGTKLFLSVRVQHEYDCVGSRRRMISATGFSGHMGKGAVLDSALMNARWEGIATTGAPHDSWMVACAKP